MSTTTRPAQLAAHLGTIDRLLPAGAGVTFTPATVTELRTAIAAAVEAAMAAAVENTTPAPAEPAPAPEIAPDLLRDMKRIKQLFRGLAYDPHDRPEEVAAVVTAARSVGLVPVPDESLFRSYRGCTPPEPAAPAPVVVDQGAAELAAEAAQYRWTPGTSAVDGVLAMLATQARPLLESLYAAGAGAADGGTR